MDSRGKAVYEKVIGWDEGRSYRVTLLAHDFPLAWAEGGVRLEREAPGVTKVTLSLDYQTKYGIFGRLLDGTALRRRLQSQLQSVLRALAGELSAPAQPLPAVVPALVPG